MTMPTSDSSKPAVTIPEELKKKFPDLIALIIGSESMNDEERQYWVNILPVMTPEQIENLRQILQNEKDQLAAIDKKYAKEMKNLGKKKTAMDDMAKQREEKKASRTSAESAAEKEERRKEAEILQSIAELED